MRKINEHAAEIANHEGKKHQSSMGDVREILGIVADKLAVDPAFLKVLLDLGYAHIQQRARMARNQGMLDYVDARDPKFK
jgi:hypothetical protein